MLRSGESLIFGLVCLWCFLAAAAGKAHLLPANGFQGGPTYGLPARGILPQIPQDPTAAFYAGQRLAAAPATIPLYIKLLNGQQGSSQAAELQFGNNHNAGHRSSLAAQPPSHLPGPIRHHAHSQGQPPLALPSPVATSSSLESHAANFGSAASVAASPVAETPVFEAPVTATPVVEPPVFEAPVFEAPVAAVAPEPSLPSSPEVTQSDFSESSSILSTSPLYLAPDTPFPEVPEAARVTGGSQEGGVVDESPEEPYVAAPSLQEPARVTINDLNSPVGEIVSRTYSQGPFSHVPLMYRLPSYGASKQEGHFIIIIPDPKGKTDTAGGKVYLATGVRLLPPHLHNDLGLSV